MNEFILKCDAYIYTHSGIIFSLLKEGNPTICNNMDEQTLNKVK
jgi:hypothetical protein